MAARAASAIYSGSSSPYFKIIVMFRRVNIFITRESFNWAEPLLDVRAGPSFRMRSNLSGYVILQAVLVLNAITYVAKRFLMHFNIWSMSVRKQLSLPVGDSTIV
jgi:hypothetical protein